MEELLHQSIGSLSHYLQYKVLYVVYIYIYIYIPGRAGFLSSATSATVKVEVVTAPSKRQAGWTVFGIIRLLKLRIAVPGQDMAKLYQFDQEET